VKREARLRMALSLHDEEVITALRAMPTHHRSRVIEEAVRWYLQMDPIADAVAERVVQRMAANLVLAPSPHQTSESNPVLEFMSRFDGQ